MHTKTHAKTHTKTHAKTHENTQAHFFTGNYDKTFIDVLKL